MSSRSTGGGVDLGHHENAGRATMHRLEELDTGIDDDAFFRVRSPKGSDECLRIGVAHQDDP